jgi:Na+/proline symporter
MNFITNIFWELFEIAIPFLLIAIPVFVIVVVIRFITDGIHAKKEGRNRKTSRTAAFIIAMVFVALMIVGAIFLAVLMHDIMLGM